MKSNIKYFGVYKKMKIKQKITEKSLKKVYEKCKPGMIKKFGRVLSYDEFVQSLAYAHDKKMF